jgi:hypothetical protein
VDEIVIRSRNPARITLEEAEELAQAIRPLAPNTNTNVEGSDSEQRPGTYGVTYFQIIEIVLPTAVLVGKELIQEITKAAVQWARARFKRKKGTPIYIPIYGPDGDIVKSVVIKNDTDEPEDRTEQDRALRDRFKKPDR